MSPFPFSGDLFYNFFSKNILGTETESLSNGFSHYCSRKLGEVWDTDLVVAVAYFSVNIIHRCETKNLAKSNMRTFRFFASLEAQNSQVISVFLLHHLVSWAYSIFGILLGIPKLLRPFFVIIWWFRALSNDILTKVFPLSRLLLPGRSFNGSVAFLKGFSMSFLIVVAQLVQC